MSLLARVSFSRDERFLTRAALGGLLGTCTAAVFTGMQGRLSFDGALAGAAVGVLVAAARLPGWVRGFVVAGAFLFFVVMAPPVPVAWVAVFALALMLAVEPRQHWATRVATFFAVVAASLWAWGVTRALSLPHLHAPWLGGCLLHFG